MERKSSTTQRLNHNVRNLTKSQINVFKPKNQPLEKVDKRSTKKGTKLIACDDTIETEFERILKLDKTSQHIDHNTNTNTISREGTSNRVSLKSLLYEICAANHWNPPVFECCKEEGPDHMKLFTFKVSVEIAEPFTTVLECFGDPQSKKKMAAEHASEGALWCLKKLGFD